MCFLRMLLGDSLQFTEWYTIVTPTWYDLNVTPERHRIDIVNQKPGSSDGYVKSHHLVVMSFVADVRYRGI